MTLFGETDQLETPSFQCEEESSGNIVCRNEDGGSVVIMEDKIRTPSGYMHLTAHPPLTAYRTDENEIRFKGSAGAEQVILNEEEVVVHQPGIMRKDREW